MIVVGIDPGTACGWALHEGGALVAVGEWDLRPRRHEGGGMRYIKFRAALVTLLESAKADLVAYEEVRRHMGVDAAHIYGGIIAMLAAVCEERGIPYSGVPVATVKKLATGKGNAQKDAMIAAAVARWPGVFAVAGKVTDNMADAAWIAEAGAGLVT